MTASVAEWEASKAASDACEYSGRSLVWVRIEEEMRMARWIVAVVLLCNLATAAVLDELLSARCQAKCLYDFEQTARVSLLLLRLPNLNPHPNSR